MGYQWAAADTLTSTRLKQTGQNVHSCTAGEAINASAAPVAVYLDSAASGNVKIASSAADSTTIVHGFVADAQNVASAAAVFVRFSGVISGFTGLTAGGDYYLSTAGAISTTGGTIQYPIGVAISTTELWIAPTAKISEGQDSRGIASGIGTQTITHNLGTIPQMIKITAMKAVAGAETGDHKTSVGTARGTNESCIWTTAVDSAADIVGQTSGRIIDIKNATPATVHDAIVSSVTPTTFILDWQTASGTGTTYFQWEAYS